MIACQKCGKSVPQANLCLHELRCRGITKQDAAEDASTKTQTITDIVPFLDLRARVMQASDMQSLEEVHANIDFQDDICHCIDNASTDDGDNEVISSDDDDCNEDDVDSDEAIVQGDLVFMVREGQQGRVTAIDEHNRTCTLQKNDDVEVTTKLSNVMKLHARPPLARTVTRRLEKHMDKCPICQCCSEAGDIKQLECPAGCVNWLHASCLKQLMDTDATCPSCRTALPNVTEEQARAREEARAPEEAPEVVQLLQAWVSQGMNPRAVPQVMRGLMEIGLDEEEAFELIEELLASRGIQLRRRRPQMVHVMPDPFDDPFGPFGGSLGVGGLLEWEHPLSARRFGGGPFGGVPFGGGRFGGGPFGGRGPLGGGFYGGMW